ncbi:hypothetical protein BDQ17DRAFT_311917 [Cyathus striatus]|nr:hypothetical protein BDQ17DRAFT_311917 [Cyathus striatus]
MGLSSANIYVRLWVDYWEKIYYEALRDLHKVCRLKTQHISRSKFKLNKQGPRIKSSTYIEDLGIGYFKTQHELEKQGEWEPDQCDQRNIFVIKTIKKYTWAKERYSSRVISPNISCLSWIGITILEDCFGIMATMLETIDFRNRQREQHEIYKERFWHTAEEEEEEEEEDWENITHVDVDGHGSESDMDCFEELSEDSVSLCN